MYFEVPYQKHTKAEGGCLEVRGAVGQVVWGDWRGGGPTGGAGLESCLAPEGRPAWADGFLE